MTPRPPPTQRDPADSATADRLWDALYHARIGKARHLVADLEDAAFRRYLPMARTLARRITQESPNASEADTEQAAELGLAVAVLEWRERTSRGFRGFAKSTIMRKVFEPQ